jgi:hypothetical protein
MIYMPERVMDLDADAARGVGPEGGGTVGTLYSPTHLVKRFSGSVSKVVQVQPFFRYRGTLFPATGEWSVQKNHKGGSYKITGKGPPIHHPPFLS